MYKDVAFPSVSGALIEHPLKARELEILASVTLANGDVLYLCEYDEDKGRVFGAFARSTGKEIGYISVAEVIAGTRKRDFTVSNLRDF